MKQLATVLLLATVGIAPLAAQAPGATNRDTTTRDTTAKATGPVAPNYSWFSDRRQLRVGDLITIVVDEQTRANEQVSTVANNNRKQAGSLTGQIMPAKLSSIGIGYDATSNNTGTSGRAGGLNATVTARITAVDANGVAHITGSRFVAIDGRKQEISLSGLIRPQDVGSGNMIASSRIADANISYKGKGISPKSGLFGKLLAAFWP
jgi:flagellar L-ring protein precursor FlgH